MKSIGMENFTWSELDLVPKYTGADSPQLLTFKCYILS
jgi:hypothetical protein